MEQKKSFMSIVAKAKWAGPVLLVLLIILHSSPAAAQSRQRPGNRPSPGGRPGNSRPPGGSRPPVARPPVTRPPVARPPVTRPPVVSHPRPVHRPVVSHRPPGWAPNRRPYTRPPVYYGGRRFYSYHHYTYHPYRPYVWGPSWNPIGFYMRTMIPGAVVISFGRTPYRYYSGVFYEPFNGGFRAVPAPPTVIVPSVPDGYESVVVDGAAYLYYGGTFYQQMGNGYVVTVAPAGAVVSQLPAGCVTVNVNGMSMLQYGNTYYQPVTVNGQGAYEVVDTE